MGVVVERVSCDMVLVVARTYNVARHKRGSSRPRGLGNAKSG